MKNTIKIIAVVTTILISSTTWAQKIDEPRMERDVEVAENVLSTLLRQQFDKQRMFFPLEVSGNYQPGYGVTFRLPADFTTPIVFSFDHPNEELFINPPLPPDISFSQDFEDNNEIEYDNENDKKDDEEGERLNEKRNHNEDHDNDRDDKVIHRKKVIKLRDQDVKRRHIKHRVGDLDSLRDTYNVKMIEAAKNFIIDYGDLISQLAPEERIVITNQGEQPRVWVGKLVNAPNRTHLSVEALKSDLSQYKQGKLNRNQLDSKIKVINTETIDKVEPDLELLSTIFDRLYQPDLARTYFTEDRIYYERLKDYGVVYYMQVFSSNQQDKTHFSMPTLKLEDVDQTTRDKKVKELYPEFVKELKENILEYGRTVKSLKDNESLVFNVRLTKCKGCTIPSTLEVSIKGDVLKDYGTGKLDKNAASNKIEIKKGVDQ